MGNIANDDRLWTLWLIRILVADHQTYQNIHVKGKCYYANKNSFITNISITKVGVYTEIAAVSFTRCFDC